MTIDTTNTDQSQTSEGTTVVARPVVLHSTSDRCIYQVGECVVDGAGARYQVDGQWRDASEVTLLPNVGEAVQVTGATGGLLTGQWLAARAQDEGAYLVTVCDQGSVIHGVVPNAKCLDWAIITVGEPVTGPHLDALKALARQVELLRNTTTAHESFMAGLVADAHDWANEHQLCGSFDSFMEQHDLEPRQHDYEVEVCGTFTVTLSRTASSFEDASEMVDETDMVSAMRSYDLMVESKIDVS